MWMRNIDSEVLRIVLTASLETRLHERPWRRVYHLRSYEKG